MTEQSPEVPLDPAATFRLDQEAGHAETEFWQSIRREEARTTLDQRQALTRRVERQADLLEAVNIILWCLLVNWAALGLGWAVAQIIGWFR